MKLIYVTCNITVQDKVLNMLHELNVKDYQIIDEVKARPVVGKPRLNNAVWPGYNTCIIMQFQNEEFSRQVMQELKGLNKDVQTDEELITAGLLPMEDYFFD